MSCQKESEILYSAWVIVEQGNKNTYILRIPSLDLICSVLKSDIFVALFSIYICFKKIKNFVKKVEWISQYNNKPQDMNQNNLTHNSSLC